MSVSEGQAKGPSTYDTLKLKPVLSLYSKNPSHWLDRIHVLPLVTKYRSWEAE